MKLETGPTFVPVDPVLGLCPTTGGGDSVNLVRIAIPDADIASVVIVVANMLEGAWLLDDRCGGEGGRR